MNRVFKFCNVPLGILLMILLSLSHEVKAKPDPANYIKTYINSGNPTFPYPQFLEYRTGKTLAKYNSEGVTHADMEKTGREAYRIMMNRCRYDGEYCGVKYISFNNFRDHDDVDTGWNTFVSEGDGYALLAAALFADQPTFNGLWMWIHDNRLSNVKQYKSNKIIRPKFKAAQLAGWACSEKWMGEKLMLNQDDVNEQVSQVCSATDGDDDIAMALLIAYKQWGEWMMQDGKPVLEEGSNEPISYKKAAQDYIKAMVDTIRQYDEGKHDFVGCMAGDIGVDGYVKGGNTWNEMTDWRYRQTVWPELASEPNIGAGNEAQYADYQAPAYYNEFARWLEEDGEGTEWQIGQFKRAEASSDWLMGQAYEQGLYPSCGKVEVQNDTEVTFSSYNAGEDFRYAWRTILNYMWHGNPTTTWNPVTHMVEDGGNEFEKKMGIRWAEFLKRPIFSSQDENWQTVMGDCGRLGMAADPGQPKTFGPSHIVQSYMMDGSVQESGMSNYTLGTAAPSIVISEDLELLGDMYRQSDLVWDGANKDITTDDERYINNMPFYFHGMFRILPLLTETGNLHAPSDMKPAANMKVYMSVDKTYVYQDDDLTYTVSFRNYGAKDAENVQIVTDFNPNYELVSIDPRGKLVGNKIIWNIGTVPGFKSDHLAETMDSVKFKVRAIGTDDPRICLTSTISVDGVEHWTSNEYPNNATYTMERNCVDILANRTLSLKKTASRTSLNPNDAVKFTLEFENKSEGESSWLNGGRDNVRVSYGWYILSDKYVKGFRFWHDAPEACINLQNYRFSYFMYDPAAVGLYDKDENPTGWTFTNENVIDQDKYGMGNISYAHQRLPYGEDTVLVGKKWNQRFMIRFPKKIMPATTHVFAKIATKNEGEDAPSNFYLMHHGDVYGPPFIRVNMNTNPPKMEGKLLEKLSDDWSFDESTKMPNYDGQGSYLSIVTPCYADVNNLGYPLTKVMRHACDENPVATFNRVLVEEFDGYTWRRVQGTGPLPGREAYDVTILDTIPEELEFYKWVDSTALKDDNDEKIKAEFISPEQSMTKSGVIKWYIPVMMVGQKDKLVYICKARDIGCPDAEDRYYKNVAWISSKTDSPDSSQVNLMTTCTELPPYHDASTSLFKEADKNNVVPGESVAYKLKFVNTEGTKVDANCTSKENWIKLGNGSLPEFTPNGVVLYTNNNAVTFYTQEKSYGKDGTITIGLSANPNSADGKFSTKDVFVVLRYKKGTPGKADFEGICIKLRVNVSEQNLIGYDLYENGTLIMSEGENADDAQIYPGNAKKPVIRFKLLGDHMYMYINDEEEDWTTVVKDWKGLNVDGPGYFGIYSDQNNASPLMTSFVTELDYAFDITLSDSLPSELTDIDNITGNGKYNSDSHSISWPTVATTVEDALAPGDSIVYTFDAVVDNCTKFINNYGFATVYGRDTMSAQKTIFCGDDCDLKDGVTAIFRKQEICAGDSTVIKVTKPKRSLNYTYEYFKKDGSKYISLNDGTPIKTDSFFIKEPGTYYVKVYNETISDCFAQSENIKLTVNALPEETLKNSPALCDGEGLDLAKSVIEGYEIKWYSDEKAKFPIEELKIDGDDVLESYFYTVTDEAGCTSKPQEMTVTKEAIPEAPIVKDAPIEVAVSNSEYSLDKHVDLPTEGSNKAWYDSNTSETPLRTPGKPMTIPVSEVGNIVYYVSAISAGGCESERVEVEVHVTSSNIPSVNNATICAVADTLDITSLAEAPTEGELVWCDETGAPLSTEDVEKLKTFSSETPNAYKFYVKTVNGAAESDVATITITTVGVGTAVTEDRVYCANDEADNLVATVDASSTSEYVLTDDPDMFEWYDGKVKLSEEGLVPSTTKLAETTTKTYKVVPTYTIEDGHVCKGDSVDLKVTVKQANSPSVTSSISYSLGDTLSDGSFKDLISQNSSAIVKDANYDLVWYDENEAELSTVPTPSVDKNALENDDVTLTYYVSQKEKDELGCESDKVKVDVLISMMPTPEVKAISFCEDDNDDTPSKTITDYVTPTVSTYTLKWYDKDKQPIGVPTIVTGKKTSYAIDTVTYYVTQVNDDAKESSKKPVNIYIYARPKLKADSAIVCSKSVDLNTMWNVANDVAGTVAPVYNYNGVLLDDWTTVNETGSYKVMGYFVMPNESKKQCISNEPEIIYVGIHKIDGIESVDVPTSACPGNSVEFNVAVEGETYDSEITYDWGTQTNNSTTPETGNFVSDPLNEPTTFTVTVSDGYCTKSKEFKVNIGDGEVKGSVIFTDANGDTKNISTTGEPVIFYTCTDDFYLSAENLDSDDGIYNWSNGETNKTVSLSVPGSYLVKFTNKCETSLKIIVEDASIKDKTVGKDKIICEGDKYEMVLDFTCNEPTNLEWKRDGVKVGANYMLTISDATTADAGDYYYNISNEDGCEVDAKYGNLKVSEAPKYTLLTDKDTTICEGVDINIGLTALTPTGARVAWESNPTLTPQGAGEIATVKPSELTTYRFTVSVTGGCDVKDSIIVDVEEPIEFTASPEDTIVCRSASSIRLSTIVTKGYPRKYAWKNESGETLKTTSLFNAAADKAGTFVYTVVLSNGVCAEVEKTSTVTVVDHPEIADVIQRSYRDVEIIPSQGNESSNVLFAVDGSDIQESTLFSGLKYGNHTAVIIDEYGCKSDFPFKTSSPDIEFPTIVTPNGDGNNDAFISETVAEAYPDARITIYDRFGKKLTEIKGDESWDGMYLGHKMPTTDYWYEIWIEEIRKKYVGHFTLINE